MSAPQPPETAVEATARAMFDLNGALSWDKLRPENRGLWRRDARYVIAAALPHLHRDWLEGLIAKAKADDDAKPSYQALAAYNWLRAELAEGGDVE